MLVPGLSPPRIMQFDTAITCPHLATTSHYCLFSNRNKSDLNAPPEPRRPGERKLTRYANTKQEARRKRKRRPGSSCGKAVCSQWKKSRGKSYLLKENLYVDFCFDFHGQENKENVPLFMSPPSEDRGSVLIKIAGVGGNKHLTRQPESKANRQ